MSSTIQRAEKRRADNYTQLWNVMLRDERLSFRARGVLSYLLTHEPGWRITLDTLAKLNPGEGRDAMKTVVAELKKFKYLKMTRERLADGRVGGIVWNVSDDPADLEHLTDIYAKGAEPQVAEPPVDAPQVAEPQVAEPQVAEPQVAQPPAYRRTSVKNTIQEEQHLSQKGHDVALLDLSDVETDFDTVWQAWPRKEDRKRAESRWNSLTLTKRREIRPLLLAHAEAYRRHRGAEFTPNLSAWLNQERWNDPVAQPRSGRRETPHERLARLAAQGAALDAAAARRPSPQHKELPR